MMTFLQLIVEFFLTGLLAVGGGLATLPFLYDIGERTGWFSGADVLNMIAVSESTPGPIGINMATFTGYLTGSGLSDSVFAEALLGLLGGITATLSLVLPSFIVIMIVAKFLDKFRSSPLTEGTFRALRPASTALITAAGLSVLKLTLFPKGIDLSAIGTFFTSIDYKSLILVAVIFAVTKLWKKGHPICFILIAAVAGIILQI